MTRLYLLEPDHHDPVWTPFGGVRPVAELRAGAWLIRERWEATAGHEATAILCDLLAGFADTTHPPVHPPAIAEGPGWVVRADVVPERFRLETPGHRRHLVCDGAQHRVRGARELRRSLRRPDLPQRGLEHGHLRDLGGGEARMRCEREFSRW